MSRAEYAGVHPLQFQRGSGPARVKRPARPVTLRTRHIAAAVGAAALLFLGVWKLYGFLLTWDRLTVREVTVACPNEALRARLAAAAAAESWGNVLLLDAASVRRRFEADPWVKEVRVRKSFPGILGIEVLPRVPAAVVRKAVRTLADETGREIAPAPPGAEATLPLLLDAGYFTADYAGRFAAAWACYASLPAAERDAVAAVDLSDMNRIVLTFRDDPTALHLALEDWPGKLAEFRREKAGWERAHGPLAYVDLRSEGRVYLRPLPAAPSDPNAGSGAAPPGRQEVR